MENSIWVGKNAGNDCTFSAKLFGENEITVISEKLPDNEYLKGLE